MPDALSVVVHRDTISQWRLATVTTETGKPSITFSSSTTGFSVGSRGTPPARARVVGGVSTLRCGNPICNYELSKGVTVNIFTLAAVDFLRPTEWSKT